MSRIAPTYTGDNDGEDEFDGEERTVVMDAGTFADQQMVAGEMRPTPITAEPRSLAPDSAAYDEPPTPLLDIGRTTALPRVEVSTGHVKLVDDSRDRYEPRRGLGAGGMGEVVLAHDHDIGRDVAIKRLHRDLQRPAIISRFVTEVRTVGALEHPNIVPIHDVGRDASGAYWFAMRFVEGESLEQVIERLRAGDPTAVEEYSFERRTDIFVGVLRALQYAHGRGVIHRDIKPANIMVGRFGEVQLMDWGIARTIGGTEAPLGAGEEPGATAPHRTASANSTGDRPPALNTTRIGSLLGTPRYMSPEQARGDHDKLDGRSDLYSAAITFWELLTLQLPYAELNAVEPIRQAVMNQPFEATRKGFKSTAKQSAPPVELLYLIDKATEKDPSARFQTALDFIAALEDIREGKIHVQCTATMTKRMTTEAGRAVVRWPRMAFVGLLALAGSVLFNVAAVTWLVAWIVTR